jgi:hypothetical protein
MPDKSCFIRCDGDRVAYDSTDPIPVIATLARFIRVEPRLPKMSENEVGFTQRVGRALGLYGVWYNKSIASVTRLRQRSQGRAATHLAPVVPLHEVEMPFPDAPPQEYASPKQLGMMRALANGQGLKGDDLKTFISAALNREVHTTGELTKRDMSKVIIDALKASEPINKMIAISQRYLITNYGHDLSELQRGW